MEENADFVKYVPCLEKADVNETVCELQCGGIGYIENLSAGMDNMTDFNLTALLDMMNDMCG
jgi:hypothetical protein